MAFNVWVNGADKDAIVAAYRAAGLQPTVKASPSGDSFRIEARMRNNLGTGEALEVASAAEVPAEVERAKKALGIAAKRTRVAIRAEREPS